MKALLNIASVLDKLGTGLSGETSTFKPKSDFWEHIKDICVLLKASFCGSLNQKE